MTETGRKLQIRERSVGLQSLPFKNHGGGVGFLSASSFGNTASNWSASQQSPPRVQDASGNWRCKT